MIQVFSNKKDKPSAYPFLTPTETGIGADKYYQYQPIEYSISADGKSWTSCFDILDLEGVYCYQAPNVQPATQSDNVRKVGLTDGQRLLSTSYDTRQITMQIVAKDNLDEGDSLLAYDALQQFLVSRDPYWICFGNWPQRMYYVKAKLSAPTFTANNWTTTVTFTDFIGLSRSITTSVNYRDYIGFGNNMTNDSREYTFTGNHFIVYNPSQVMIDPVRRNHELVITCEGSSSGNMLITNKTTGDCIGRKGATSGGNPATNKEGLPSFDGKWELNGVRVTLDGKSDQMQTTDGYLMLQPGDNEITVDNFSGKITFDFPFWWLS